MKQSKLTLSTQVHLFGEKLAQSILQASNVLHCSHVLDKEKLDCFACGADHSNNMRYAVVYGKPSVICDVECYDMLRANWQFTEGRI